VDGHQLKKSCICHLYGFSRNKLDKRISHFILEDKRYNFDLDARTAAQLLQHGNTGNKAKKPTLQLVKQMTSNWITNALDSLVDNDPSVDLKYMLCYLKVGDLLEDLCDHLRKFGITAFMLPKIGLLKSVITSEHPTLRFPRNTKLGVCNLCTLLRTCKMLATTNAEKKQIKQQMRAHTEQHRSERRIFYARREDSALHPSIQWSTLSDSTSRLCLPYLAPLPKGWSTVKRLGISVFGLINFATKYRCLIPIPPVWKQNSNFTISLTYQHYYNMLKQPNVPRAPVLYETSDGSPKEYKNMVNMCHACFKVLVGMFDEVNMIFLPPGHSHDLQDQAWKHLKRAFYSSRVITWNDLLTIMKRAFSSFQPEVITDIFIFDWKTWFQPWMTLIKNHASWRAFKFFKNPQKPHSVMMMWKENEFSNEAFHGSDEHPEGIELLLEMPPGTPARIYPSTFDMTKLEKVETTFPNMTPAEKIWWEEVLNIEGIPDYCNTPIPDDYFDFEKFKYSAWLEEHPYMFQTAETLNDQAARNIVAQDERGVTVSNRRFIDLFIADFVSFIVDDEWTIGKIRAIITATNNSPAKFNVWCYKAKYNVPNINNSKMIWEPLKLTATDSTRMLELKDMLTVRFKLTRNKMRVAAINMILDAKQLRAETTLNANSNSSDASDHEEENTTNDVNDSVSKRDNHNSDQDSDLDSVLDESVTTQTQQTTDDDSSNPSENDKIPANSESSNDDEPIWSSNKRTRNMCSDTSETDQIAKQK